MFGGEGFGGTEDVAGGELAGSEELAEELSLCAFADAGGAEQDEPPWAVGGGDVGAFVSGAFEPRGSVVGCGHKNLVKGRQ